MTDNYVVGDFITDMHGIYQITNIEPNSDQEDAVLYYKPISKTDKNYVAHIPLNSLRKAGLRKVFSRENAIALIDTISASSVLRKYDFGVAREDVYSNNPEKIIPILSYIWINQEMLSKGDKDLMWQIIENLSREISFVTKKELNKIKDHITEKLAKLNKTQ